MAEGENMKLSTSEKAGKLTIAIGGELDHHGAREAARRIEETIEASVPRDCVIDLRELRFMDSSGIAIILRVYKRLNAIGGRLTVENVPEQPMRVLDASGIDRMIDINAMQTERPV